MAQLKPHVGAAIMSAADTYPKVIKVVLEAIQNSMDAGAINIWLVIDWKKRRIDIYDDGEGVSPEKFHRALATVGRTIKSEDEDVYGRFGRGLVAPLGKCSYFTFTSNGIQWRFDTDKIRDSEDVVDIPEKYVDIVFSRSEQKRRLHSDKPNWRSRVSIFDITKSSRIANFDVNDLISEALTSFRTKMLERGTMLHVTVEPPKGKGQRYTLRRQAEPYSGEHLDKMRLELDSDRAIEIDLYLALKIDGKLDGEVSVGTFSSPFRVAFKSFADSAVRELLDSEVIKALNSGIFEGEILSNALTLHPDRTHYVDDDGLVEVCIALEKWFENVGSLYYKEALSREDSERFERAAEKALDALSKLFEDPNMKVFADLVNSFPTNPNGIGASHAGDGEKEVPAGEQPSGTAKSSGSGGKKSGSKSGTSKPSSGNARGEGTKKRLPDPTGESKTTIKNQEFGLRLGETQYLPGPWQLDLGQGVLWINTKHDLYLRCADSRNPDRTIRLYQQQVVIQALSLHCATAEVQAQSTEVLDIALQAYVALLIQ